MMTTIGITGGIGSGKSTLSRLLETSGVPVYIADTEAKKLMNTSPDIKGKLIQKFGEAIYSEYGLNREKLASLIFCDPEAVAYVNSIVHPAVRADFIEWAEYSLYPLIAVESAILFESRLDALVDFTVTVSAPLEIRMERILQRDRLSEKEITDRIANQMPEEEKIDRSDFVIINDDYHALIPQAEALINLFSNQSSLSS